MKRAGSRRSANVPGRVQTCAPALPTRRRVIRRNDSGCSAVPIGKVEEPMNVGDEKSRSLWMDIDVAPSTPTLGRDAECDTVIVGSGIAGLSTAYELSGQGQKVIVLDRGTIG